MENYINGFFKLTKEQLEEKTQSLLSPMMGNSDIITLKSKIDKLYSELKKSQYELQNEYEKVCKGQYSDAEKNIYFSYTARDNTTQYYNRAGISIVNTDIPPEATIISLPTKKGKISYVCGYAYEVSGIIVKQCSYKITTTKLILEVESRTVYCFINNTSTVKIGETTNTLDGLRYGIREALRTTNASEFLSQLYGVEKKVGFSLEQATNYRNTNPCFEIIIKTAPDNLLEHLLRLKDLEKPMPVYKIIGVSQELYELLCREDMADKFLSLKEYINDKETFHKTSEEWIETIKEYTQIQNEMDFYKLNYTSGGRFYNYGVTSNLCPLLRGLADTYKQKAVLRKHYSFGKFAKYVVEEVVNQGYARVSDFCEELVDYLNMCEDQTIVPTLFTSYLKQTHDIAARNHRIFVDEQSEKLFAKRYEGFITLTFGSEGDRYYIIAPKSSEEIKKEGDSLNHCVASYIKRVIDGTCQIFFLRKKKDESLITLEVRDGRIAQARGMHNRRPSSEENIAIRKFANKMSLKYEQ